MNHIANHIKHPALRGDNTLHVVGVVSNPVRYHSRYRLAREFVERMRDAPNVVLHIVEAQHGDRHHEIAGDGDLKLRTDTEIWIKENMINLGVRHLVPREAKYICWADMDIAFRDPNWAQETLHQLQTYEVVQPWQNCADLGYQGAILQTHESFGSVHQRGVPKQRLPGELSYTYAHSGFAWACTRRFWESTGGLLDFCILGSADHHMAHAMIGDGDFTIPRQLPPSYFDKVGEWERRAMLVTKGQVGYTPGRIEHDFHGPKKRRFYNDRWKILFKHGFDPSRDLTYDEQGVIQLVGKPELEHAIRQYNRSRFEDSIDE